MGKCIEEYAKDETNCRKILAATRGAYGSGQNPRFPKAHEVKGIHQIRVYTDGGLTSPDRKWWSLGGYGVWWPDERGGQQFNESFADVGLAKLEYKAEGVGMYSKNMGQRSSSTRMELAGAIVAMTRAVPLHMLSDSQSMIDKLTMLINVVDRGGSEAPTKYCRSRSERKIFRRPFEMQSDGDLWKIACATRISKVKGHATWKEVEQGLVQKEDEQGNDQADEMATKGIGEYTVEARRLAGMLKNRHKEYEKMVHEVQTTILRVIKKGKELREEQKKRADQVHGYDTNLYDMVTASIPEYKETKQPFQKVDIVPTVKGTHRYMHNQAMYEAVHRFVGDMEWRKSAKADGGTTWIELMAMFELMGYRPENAEYVQEAKVRGDKKTSHEKKASKVNERRKRRHGEDGEDKRQVSLSQELEIFKALVRHMFKQHVRGAHKDMVDADTNHEVRRLNNLAVTGFNAVSAAQVKALTMCRQEVANAIMRQKKGMTDKAMENIKRLKHEEEGEEKIRLKNAAIDMRKQAQWKPRTGGGDERVTQEKMQVAHHADRKIRCVHCPTWQETGDLILRTCRGYRTINCHRCGRTNRVALSKCQCGLVWHHCDKHMQDPPVERSRAVKRKGNGKEERKDEEKGKDIARKVPRRRLLKPKRRRGGGDERNPWAAEELMAEMHIMKTSRSTLRAGEEEYLSESDNAEEEMRLIVDFERCPKLAAKLKKTVAKHKRRKMGTTEANQNGGHDQLSASSGHHHGVRHSLQGIQNEDELCVVYRTSFNDE